MPPNEDSAPQALDRKELLAQQFSEVESPATTTTADTAPATKTDDRARDEAGKFVQKTKDAEPKIVSGNSPEQKVPGLDVAEPPAWAKPPASWKKDYHQGWDGLPDNIRQYVHDRETQMRAGVEPLLPRAQMADAISKAAEPYMNTIRGLGIELPQAVGSLMQADHNLRTLPHDQKLQYLGNLARHYGIDLSGQMQQAQPVYDQNYQALQNDMLGLKGQLAQFQQDQRSAADQSAQSEIQKFSTTAEHFEDAKPTMIKLLQGGMADNIKDAYEQAIYLDPSLREKVLTAQQARTSADAKAAANAAAQRAKAAAVSPKSATPGVTAAPNAKDRRSMLAEQFASVASERL